MYSLSCTGDILDYEHDNYYIEETYDRTTPKKQRADHYDMSFGMSIDLVPFDPIVLGNESHAIKFGIRAGYFFNYIDQTIEVKESSDDAKEYGGTLVQYNNWMVGPIIYYAPSIEPVGIGDKYSAKGGFTMYVLFGMINSGTLSAFPAKRDHGEDVSNYETSVSGYKINAGIGTALSVCSINIGLNLYYSRIQLKMSDEVYSSIGKKTTIDEICFELYWGIPIEWFSSPEVF